MSETEEDDDIAATVAANFKRDLDAIMKAQGTVETGWLCEWNMQDGPEWWTLEVAKGARGHFTKDSTKALRFARKQDAEAFIEHYGWTEALATEHQWSDLRKGEA